MNSVKNSCSAVASGNDCGVGVLLTGVAELLLGLRM